MADKALSLTEHLEELRKVIIISAVTLLICSLAAFFLFGEKMVYFITRPLQELEVPVVVTRVGEAFLARVKLSLLGGFALSFPVIASQWLTFFLPALTPGEKRLVLVAVPLAVVLFAGGVTFACFVVLPLTLRFFLVTMAGGLAPMISMRDYLSFVFALVVPFGLLFQMPLAAFALARVGLVSAQFLRRKRRQAFLTIFVLAAVLTPSPDIFSQLMLALPMVALYEASILVATLACRFSRKSFVENEVTMAGT